MSYATGTTHYNLPQTVGTDKRDWTDTNEAFSAVDTALYGAVQDAETATSGIQTLNTAVDTINGKLATDEGNISTLSGKVSTLESTVSGHTSAIADVRSDLQDNIESRKEASATSTHAYSIGDTFYYNDVLYKATANIGVGDTIVPNTNCTGITVMSEIQNQTAPTAAQISYDGTSSGLTADDVQEAIDELAADKGSVQVTGDGTKTYTQLLNELFDLINFSKISMNSHLVYKQADLVESFPINQMSESLLTFSGAINVNTTALIIFDAYKLAHTGSEYARSQLAASSVTSTLFSSTAAADGTIFKINY